MLVFLLFLFNGVDWLFFWLLDIGNATVEALSPAAVSVSDSSIRKICRVLNFPLLPQRCIDGLFQALATRTAGFQVVNLAEVAPALQFTLAVVMYIVSSQVSLFPFSPSKLNRPEPTYGLVLQSAYPLAISVRSTNAYEDQSVGIHETEEYEEAAEEQNQPSSSFLLSHVRRQLSFDIGFLAFAIFLLCVLERHRIGSDDWR